MVLVPVCNYYASHVERGRGSNERVPHMMKSRVDHDPSHDVGTHVDAGNPTAYAAHTKALHVAIALDVNAHEPHSSVCHSPGTRIAFTKAMRPASVAGRSSFIQDCAQRHDRSTESKTRGRSRKAPIRTQRHPSR